MSQHDQIMAALEGILKRLDGIDDRLADGDEKITQSRIDIATLKVKAGLWGGGAVVLSILGGVAAYFLKAA